jgi:hypothetical protein
LNSFLIKALAIDTDGLFKAICFIICVLFVEGLNFVDENKKPYQIDEFDITEIVY